MSRLKFSQIKSKTTFRLGGARAPCAHSLATPLYISYGITNSDGVEYSTFDY